MNALTKCYENGGTVYVFGNGGSSATASHMVCDFNKGVSFKKSKKFNFICLSDNTPILTALANDISYDDIFAYQIEKILNKDDLVLAIPGYGKIVVTEDFEFSFTPTAEFKKEVIGIRKNGTNFLRAELKKLFGIGA